jgi:hypothetical protein
MLVGLGIFCLIAAGICWNLGYKGFAIFYIIVAIFDFFLSLRKKPITFGIQQPAKKENPERKDK